VHGTWLTVFRLFASSQTNLLQTNTRTSHPLFEYSIPKVQLTIIEYRGGQVEQLHGHSLWVNSNTATSIYQVKRTVATLLTASENVASAFC